VKAQFDLAYVVFQFFVSTKESPARHFGPTQFNSHTSNMASELIQEELTRGKD